MDDERQAFRSLYERSNRRVLAYCARRCNSYDDALDAAAETYAVAWRRWDAVPDGDAALLWLFGTARRVLANRHRSTARRRRLGERLRGGSPRSAAQDPLQILEDREAGHEIVEALNTLSESDRELLRLSVWEGLKPVELSTLLDCSRRTVDVRLHRARRRLAAAYDRAQGSSAGGSRHA